MPMWDEQIFLAWRRPLNTYLYYMTPCMGNSSYWGMELPCILPMDALRFANGMTDCTVVDTHSPLSFAGGHIKGSYNIWLGGLPNFACWIFDYERDVISAGFREIGEDISVPKHKTLSGLSSAVLKGL